MSYILDALKKSEKMRKQGDVPDLQALHVPMPDEEKTHKVLYLVIVILLVSIAFLIGVYQPWKADIVINKKIAIKEIHAPMLKKKTIEKIVMQPKIKFKQVNVKQIKEKTSKSVVQTEQEISQQAIRQVPRLSELSAMVQQAIPNMIFAGHVYSSNKKQRSIIINGYAMSEGDVVVNGLKVKQITADGVIFDYQGQLFREEILQDWSFD